MADSAPKTSRLSKVLAVVAAFAAAYGVFYFIEQPLDRALMALHLDLWRGRDWPNAPLAFRVLDRFVWHASRDVVPFFFDMTLWAATALVPLGLVVRSIARARLRAGLADPLDRVRRWVDAHPRLARAAAAVVPVAMGLYSAGDVVFSFGPDSPWTERIWVTSVYGAVATLAAIALTSLSRVGLRALLVPTLDRAINRADVASDEITFDAVAVTRETQATVGALAALTVAMTAWLLTLSTRALFHDRNVMIAVIGYVALALGGAALFRRASKVAVGVDGVHVTGTSRTRFFAYRDLDAARVNGIDLELVRRDAVVLRLQLHGEDAARRQAVLDRIREAIDRVKEGKRDGAMHFVSTASSEELARAAQGGGDYRAATVSRDQLWTLVEGPAIDSVARRIAAEALSRTSDVSDRARLRVAAEQCAEPLVRVALRRLADGDAGDPAEDAGELAAPRRIAAR